MARTKFSRCSGAAAWARSTKRATRASIASSRSRSCQRASLKKGAFPLDQALQYAIQTADALAAAHRAGITHRDLKPGNIMLVKAGAKVLDFGLAKHGAGGAGRAGQAGGAGAVVAQGFSPANLSALPTMSAPLTAEGTILGTFQYMAPEQLEGKDADARTDIFAFGALVYEMVTGKRAFEGKSQASLIGAILKDEPPPISTMLHSPPRSACGPREAPEGSAAKPRRRARASGGGAPRAFE